MRSSHLASLFVLIIRPIVLCTLSCKPKIVYQAYSDQLEKFGHVEDDIELFLKSWGYTIESSDLFKSWGITYKVAHI